MCRNYQGKFVEIEEIGDDVRLFKIELDSEIEFESGQFVNLSYFFEGEKCLRPYSIASGNFSKKVIELCINLVVGGETTFKLFQKKVGDECFVRGPLGLFKLQKSNDLRKEKVVLIGTGTGIASLRSILLEILRVEDREVCLIYGNRFSNGILFESEFDKFSEEFANFKFRKVISQPDEDWIGRVGYVQNNLDSIDFLNSEFYVCGRPKMIEDVKEKLVLNGVDEKVIYFEKYV